MGRRSTSRAVSRTARSRERRSRNPAGTPVGAAGGASWGEVTSASLTALRLVEWGAPMLLHLHPPTGFAHSPFCGNCLADFGKVASGGSLRAGIHGPEEER